MSSVSFDFWKRSTQDGLQKKTYIVPHVRGTHEVGADVVGPLELICYSAVVCHFSTVIDEVFACKKRCRNDPVVGLVGPIRVGLVTGISSQTCG